MDEQQIIGDILDRLYGYDSDLKEDDSETIKAKKKEKDEKSEEFMTQINNICKDLENELKAVIGPDIREIKKTIRLQVLTTIKAEIDNGNNVIDSNGKISVGKTFDIIMQSKSEILENIQNENDAVNYKKEDGDIISEDSKEDKMLNNFFEQLEDAGVELSQDEKDLMAEAVARVNEIMNMIKEKVDLGMSKDEALKSILNEMSREEIELLRAQFVLVGQCKLLDSLLEEEKKDQTDLPEIEKKTGKEDSSKRNANGKTNGYQEQPRTNSFPDLGDFQETFNALTNAYEGYFKGNGDTKFSSSFTTQVSQQIQDRMNLAKKINEVIFQKENDLERSGGIIVKKKKLKENNLDSAEVLNEQRGELMARHQDATDTIVAQKTNGESSALPKNVKATVVPEVRIEQAKRYTTPLHEVRHAIVDKRLKGEDVISKEMAVIMGSKISDKNLGPYFDGQSELLTFSFSREDSYTDISMIGELEGRNGLPEMRDDDTGIIGETVSITPASAPTSTTPPPSTSTSIVDEITVDESGVTQEGQSEPSKKGTLSASALKALVESQAEVRKIFEANEIIHGQIPEKPTVEKSNTQGTPVADNDEKSGGEPEER